MVKDGRIVAMVMEEDFMGIAADLLEEKIGALEPADEPSVKSETREKAIDPTAEPQGSGDRLDERRYDLPEGREIGRVVGDAPGPTLIVVAGIHGNECAGVGAVRRVLATLTRRQGRVMGELVALAGNLGAMRLGIRYRERDMNRVWTKERIADLESAPRPAVRRSTRRTTSSSSSSPRSAPRLRARAARST